MVALGILDKLFEAKKKNFNGVRPGLPLEISVFQRRVVNMWRGSDILHARALIPPVSPHDKTI
eukprot:2112027-Ditylum_brightwellii.AAC.1